jgi:hypothetical protein
MAFQPEPLVTGDAVQLDVSIAQLPVRALAALIDVTVMAAAYAVLSVEPDVRTITLQPHSSSTVVVH